MLKIATLIATLVAASTLATQAEAHGMGSFYASPFFRNQGRQPAEPHCEKKKRIRFEDEAFAHARARRLRQLEAERAAEAAAASAAAKRARLAAQKRHDAAQTTDLKDTSPPPLTTGSVTPKNDSPASQTSKATTTKTAQADDKDTIAKSASLASPVGCRSYSPAANGLVDVPCK